MELIGKTIANRFRVESHIQSFGGRSVFLGRQVALERPVLIKVLEDEGNADLTKRFLHEGRTLARLDHPGIVSVIDVGEHEGHPYMVTEAPAGPTLETLLEEQGHFDWTTARAFLTALADAVGYAHDAGLVHRDLHPRNVVVGEDGRPRITDFVFAHELAPFDEEAATQLITKRGAVVGAVEWAAPEQLMGFGVDARADLYALGVLAYRMTSGRVPHKATRAAEVLSLQNEGAVPLKLEADLPDAAAPFCGIVDRLLAPEADARGFENASALAVALRTLPAPEEVATEPALPESGWRDRVEPYLHKVAAYAEALPVRVRIGVAAGAAVLLLAGAIGAIASSGDEEIAAEPVVAEQRIDPALLALRERTRAAARRGDIPRALHGFRTLVRREPAAFEPLDLAVVARYLARPNSNTAVAEDILMAADRDAVIPVLRNIFEDERSSRYLKRRTGEVLEKLGQSVDLVPLWVETLSSEQCGARKLAVRKLAESGDPRAIPPLSDLSKRTDQCGAASARLALKKLQASS